MKTAACFEIAFGRNDIAKSWLRDVERVAVSEPFQSAVVLDGETVKGVVLFFNKTLNDIEIGLFGKGLLTRRMLRFIGTYCFVDNECIRITARTNAINSTARETLERAGFKEEGRLSRFCDPHDAIIYGLLRDTSKLWHLVK